MKKLIIIFAAWIILHVGCSANVNSTEDSGSSIPFIIEKKSPLFLNKSLNSDISESENITTEVSKLASSEIKSIIKTFKEDVCIINKQGEFEITIKIDVSGKVLGIGASGEGGLKATIRCS